MTEVQYRRKEGGQSSLPAIFEEIYAFGSALHTESCEDIDLLLVYDDGEELCEVAFGVELVRKVLLTTYEGRIVDLTTLSRAELGETKLLDMVPHKRIR